MSDYFRFLGDFLERVLLTQPLKQLARLKTVNRQWRDIISDPQFAKSVLDKEGSNGLHPSRSICLVCNSKSFLGAIELKKLVKTKQDFMTLNFPEINFPIRKVVGCCQGLICLIDSTKNLLVFNPRTSICRTVMKDEQNFNRSYSFGYQLQQGVSCHVIMKIDDPPFHCVQSLSLFNLKTNRWKRLTLDTNKLGWNFKVKCDMAGVFVKGYFCWLGQVQMATGVLGDSIIIFNGTDESFDYILLPQSLIGSRLCLGNLGEDSIAVWEIPNKSCIWSINLNTKELNQMGIKGYASEIEFTPLCFCFGRSCLLMLDNAKTMRLYNFTFQKTVEVYNHQEKCLMRTYFAHHEVQAICFRDTLLSPFE